MNLFYLNAKGKPTGPVTLAQLESLIQQGALSPHTLVTREGDKAWIPFSQIPPSSNTMPVPTRRRPESPFATAATRPPTASFTKPQPAAPPRPTVTATPAPHHGSYEISLIAIFTEPTDFGERLLAIAGVIGLIGFFLPWIELGGAGLGFGNAMNLSFSGWNATFGQFGVLSLLLIPAAALATIVVAGKLHNAPNLAAVRLARIPLAVGAAVAVVAFIAAMAVQQLVGLVTMATGMRGISGKNLPQISVGIGLWLTVLAFFTQLVGAWLVIGKRSRES